jgi:hypothetical protein
MKRKLGLGLLLSVLASGCLAPPEVEEGGANANDRTFGGEQGEALLTGAMEVSPSGHFVVMQRNTITVILDVTNNSYIELDEQFARVAMSHEADVAYAILQTGELIGFDLVQGVELWRDKGPYGAASMLKLADDDSSIVVVNGNFATVLDPATGKQRFTSILDTEGTFGTILPKAGKIAIVGRTSWPDHKPSTPVSLLDLKTGDVASTTIANCEAPVTVVPEENRLLVSPTFCEEGRDSDPDDQWTNPDPVSIVDIAEDGSLTFLKNLPGFGPVALSADGKRAVAYLDTKRVDASMFEHKSQVPPTDGPEYHIMVIDPKTLEFSVTPIGNGLPRFALSRDGKGLLVDSSVKVVTRMEANANASIEIGPSGISGEVSADATVFNENTPFGYFDLESLAFMGFSGPQAGLDRFVQLGDMKTVLTLEKRTDGLGGVPFLIDLEAKSTIALGGNYGTGVRDVGLLPDGKTILLRFRQAAAQIGNELFARETYCLSLDGLVCASGQIEYQASVSFASVETNDCASMGHDCW